MRKHPFFISAFSAPFFLAALFFFVLAVSPASAVEKSPSRTAAVVDEPEDVLPAAVGDGGNYDDIEWDDASEGTGEGAGVRPMRDPIEPFNRAMFVFNDKMYFWVLKPVARGYNHVVPEKGRVGIKRFFTNLTTPVRLVNSLLQFKFKYAGTELSRFAINTTVGVLGFSDPARDRWEIYQHDEDLGQTLGVYGSGPGLYVVWPILGPSSLRDTVGFVGDLFLDPATYLFAEKPMTALAVESEKRVNSTSLSLGVYEDMKASAIDPYTFIRDAYNQYRESHIKE